MLPQAAVNPPIAPISLTPDRAWIERELIMCALSPQYFIERYCQIYDSVAQNWIPFTLWNIQKDALKALHAHKLTVALKPRQVGFTWLGLAYDLWGMLFRPIWVGLIFSRRDDEAMYLLGEDRLRGMYKRLPSWMRAKSVLVDSAHEFKLSNGSVSRAFPTTAGDGYTATYVLIDEADLQPDLNQLMRAVKPTIDAGGKLFMISRVNKRTPNSEFKRTYQSAKAGGNGWAHLFIGWDAHPDRDRAWYETQKREVMERTGSLDDLYEQYPSTDAEALAPRSLDKRIAPTQLLHVYAEQRPLDPLPPDAPSLPGLRVFALPEPGVKYVIGADPAEGNPTSDDSAAQIINDATGEQVAVLQGKFEPSVFAGSVSALSRWYNKAAVMPERNNHGHALILWLKDNARDVNVLTGEDKKAGWHSTSKGKVIMYSTLADDVREEETTIHDSATFEQIASIEGSTLRAPGGGHDDLADAYALALQARAASRVHIQTGDDPIMSIFDQINARADAAKAAKAAAQDGWWKDRALWSSPGRSVSVTEAEALEHLWADCPADGLPPMPPGLVEVRAVTCPFVCASDELLPPLRIDPMRWSELDQVYVFDLDLYYEVEIVPMVEAWRDTRIAYRRDERAMLMRADGYTFTEIAAELGYKDKSGACHAVQRLQARIDARLRDDPILSTFAKCAV